MVANVSRTFAVTSPQVWFSPILVCDLDIEIFPPVTQKVESVVPILIKSQE